MISTIGNRLKELRQNRNLMQAQVATLIGVDRSAISLYKSGERQPAYDVLVKLARLYHVSTDYILGQTVTQSIDASGLSTHEVELICELVYTLAEKNEKLGKPRR